jgi:hypothetical protein
MITHHAFLDELACDAVVARMHERTDLAIDRRADRPRTFLTYGRAAYLDACAPGADPQRDYHARVAEANRGMQEAFGHVYAQLRGALERLLDAPVAYAPERLALPGMHVFRGEGVPGAGHGGAHFDVQYAQLPLAPDPDPDAEPISVTVPLAIPSGGTGLRVYDVTHASYQRAWRAGRVRSVGELARRKQWAYHAYARGNLVLHRGLVLHGLSSPVARHTPDDERITLQCHGLRASGTWILYW